MVGVSTCYWCKVGTCPLKYLGLPLSRYPKSLSFWDRMVEKVSRKLAHWMRLYVSLGERTTLIKEAMPNIPMYYMSLFKRQCKIVKVIEKISKRFPLRGWEGRMEKKDHLLKWDVVIK